MIDDAPRTADTPGEAMDFSSILVLRPGAMGDVLLTTPALRALKRAFPKSHLAMLVTRPGKEVLEGNTDVTEVIVLDKSSWWPQVEIVTVVRRKRFELVIDFLCNPRTALITRLSGAPYRVGYGIGARRFAYNIVRPRDQFRDGKKVVKYAAEVNLDMVRHLGIAATDTTLSFTVRDEARRRIGLFLESNGLGTGSFVAVSPSGSWPAKTWDVGKFARLADLIVRRCGAKVVILWGPGEKALAERAATLMTEKALVACETTIGEVGAMLERSTLLVSNDSGLKHIAVALEIPTVTVYGPTNPKTWNPVSPRHRAVFADVECLFCDKNECESMKCMEQLSPEDMFSAVRETLSVFGRAQ